MKSLEGFCSDLHFLPSRSPGTSLAFAMMDRWKLSLLLVLAGLLIGVALAGRCLQPENPIIAIVTMPLVDCVNYAQPPAAGVDPSAGCLNSFYGRWLDTAGVRNVPLPWNAPTEAKNALLDQVNGVFLPGGDLYGDDWMAFYQNMTSVLDYAMRRNSAGDPFFVWGTCQGFQVVATLVARDPSILKCVYRGVEPKQLPLTFTDYGATSSLMFSRDPQMVALFQTKNITLNLHTCGITPEDWQNNEQLRSTLNIVATNVDAAGRPFVSAFEGKGGLNVFGVQFHPERAQLHFVTDAFGHTDDDITGAIYLAKFVRQQLRLNMHRFSSPEAASRASTESWLPMYLGYGSVFYWMPGQVASVQAAVIPPLPPAGAQTIALSGDVLTGLVVGFFLLAVAAAAARMMMTM